MKEQSKKQARKHIKIGCYLKVTLVYRWLTPVILTNKLTGGRRQEIIIF
jgi:hypothetical protein